MGSAESLELATGTGLATGEEYLCQIGSWEDSVCAETCCMLRNIPKATCASALCIGAHNVTIEAEELGTVVLDASRLRRVISITSGGMVHLIGLSITGGHVRMEADLYAAVMGLSGAGSGAGLFVGSGGRVHLEDCNLYNHTAGLNWVGGGGGSMFVAAGGQAQLTRCNIFENRFVSASVRRATVLLLGGGLFIASGGEVNLQRCDVYENSGGMYVAGKANLDGCKIHNNAAIDGGGLFIGASPGREWQHTIPIPTITIEFDYRHYHRNAPPSD